MIPENLKYSETHEWLKTEKGSDAATVGITEFAAEHIGDIVFMELPVVGDKLAQGSPLGVVESVKAAFDLNSPVSGEVVEVNEQVTGDFDRIAQDPCGEGWLVKVKIENIDEIASLMDAAQYEEFLKSQED
jgi:glycine cleavage system H protein